MRINVRQQGGEKLKQQLSDMAAGLTRMKNFWGSVGSYVQRRTIKERFDKEQSPDGTKWQKLSPSTVKRRTKRHKGGDMRILQDTGELRRSVHFRADDGGVAIGTNVKYARTHQYGRGKIPARPFLGINAEEREHIMQMVRTLFRRLNGGT
jgi:phage virion morphogenesis protein